MKIAFVVWSACSLFLLLLSPGATWSQGFQGTIRGDVHDPSGALIPGATVTVTNVVTGETRSQVSSDSGTFNFPNLLVSSYTVTVELPGFRKHTRENVQVTANTIIDVVTRLELGVINEAVLVTTGQEKVNVSSAQLLGFTTQNVVDLPNPVPSGNPNNFAILAPGTTTMPGGVAGQGGSIGGNRPRNNNFVVDGVDNNDPSTTGALTPVIAEAVQEFTLITNQFSAEYGHSTAGQFITTTRSGGNQFHGGGWWYSQNRHTNSLDNLTRAVTAPGGAKPRYDWNRFGGRVGGPIVRDKWFFFSAYEYQNKTLAGASSAQVLVPTEAGLATLKTLASTSGTGISPVNVGIIADHVPVAALQTKTVNVTNEATGSAVPIAVGAFSGVTPNYDRTHLFLGNSDYQMGKHRLSGRYSYSRNPFVVAGTLAVPEFNSDASIHTQRMVFSDVFVVGPRIVNEFRAGYNRYIEDRSIKPTTAPSTTDVFGNYNMTDLNLLVGPTVNPQSRKSHIYEFSNTTSLLKGGHTLKFGVEVRNIISESDFLPRARGEYTWPTLDDFVRDRFPATTSIRGVGIGAFAQNRTAYYSFIQDTWKIHPRLTLEFGLRYEYTGIARDSSLQDLNSISDIASIRDERFTTDLVSATDPRLGTPIFNSLPSYQQAAILGRFGEELHFRKPKADSNNFGPRIGLSWNPFGDGKTSVRAGFGIAHDIFYGNLPLLLPAPQMQAENRESNACSFSPTPAWCPFVTGGNPRTSTGIRYSNTGFIEGGALLPFLTGTRVNKYVARNATGAYVIPQEKSPETYTWSLSVQREQFRDWMFEFRYIGNRSVFLPIQEQLNAGVPNPIRLPLFLTDAEAQGSNFTGAPTLAQFIAGTTRLLAPYGFAGVLSTLAPDGQSWYHGASISAEKKLSKGLLLNTSYTFSKTIDIIENDVNSGALNPRRPKDAYNVFSNKGLSGLHRAHKFVASWIYELPRYQGNPVLSRLLNEWQFIGSYILESGQPVSILSTLDTNGDGDTAGDTVFFNPAGRENVGSDVNFVCRSGTTISIAASATACGGNGNVVGYVARTADAQYIRGREGMATNLGRNTFMMPGINTANLSLFKNIAVGEDGKKLQFRVEMYNAFNHPSFTLGSGTVLGSTGSAAPARNAAFATPGSTQFLNTKTISGGMGSAPFQRIIQWGLKLTF